MEELAADTSGDDSATFSLPRSFPAELLNEEQLDEVKLWFDSWAADLLHEIRAALSGSPEHAGQQTLAHLQQRAVILAHLLRLHPAAESSISQLATAMGISRRSAFYMQDSIMQHIRPALCSAISGAASLADFTATLAATGTLQPHDAQQLTARSLAVPFKPAVHCAHRFATALKVADHPAVSSVREDFMPGTTKNALHITLKH